MGDEVDTAAPATSKTPLAVKMYPWESRHEWVARISFIEDHLPTYGYERALSLSMVWANMKFLGCRYPDATERLVMHYNVPETDKSRTFPSNGCYIINAEDFPDGIPLGSLSRDENDEYETVEKEGDSDTATQVSMLISNIRERVETEKLQGDVKPAGTVSPEMLEICRKLVLPQVISQEEHPVSLLTLSCQKANLMLSFAFKEHVDKTAKHPRIIGFQATILINDTIVGKGDSYSTKKDAKKHACEVVIERIKSLQESTGCVPVPAPVNSECVQKSEILSGNGSTTQKAVPVTGVGGQLLRKMGWSEEDAAQPSQPFDALGNLGRSGLGFAPQESTTLRQNVEQKLNEFVNSDKDELVFSAEFNSEERKMIHNLCTQYKLHHKSHGKGDERKLVIQKRPNAQASTSTTEQSKYNQHYEFHHSYEHSDSPQQRPYKGKPAIQSGFFQHAVDKASRSHPYHDYRQQHHPHQMWEGRR